VNPLDELGKLTSLFPADEPLIADARHIPKSETPEPYAHMLVHDQHMTVTMEEYHRCPVEVHVIQRHLDGDLYNREIVLTRTSDGAPVQFGIVQFDFQYVTRKVREEILAEETPLGRILINHNVLRHVDLGAILAITAGPGLAKVLRMPVGGKTYGRLATIFCNHQPAVDLLEIPAPLT
jgi:chorismate-pyruvate lyase